MHCYFSVKPDDDPDKPVMTALGFLGKLPGGKLLAATASF